MKKLFTLLMALPLFLHAQEKGDVELNIGAGLNLVGFYGGDAEGYNLRSSFQAGITGEYYLNEEWGLKTGLIYDSKGGEGLTENKIQVDYLFVPLYASWHFGMDREWYVNFGPHLDFLLVARENGGAEINDNIESFDVGLGAGIGRRFPISDNAAVFIEYQAATGFLEVPSNGGADIYNMRSAFNAGIVFTP